jgi:hypothetical protein
MGPVQLWTLTSEIIEKKREEKRRDRFQLDIITFFIIYSYPPSSLKLIRVVHHSLDIPLLDTVLSYHSCCISLNIRNIIY